MNRLIKALSNAFTAQFVTFIAGVLISEFFSAVFGAAIPWNEGLVAIASICFVVLAIAVLAGIRQDVNARLVQSRLSVNVHYALRTPQGDAALYDPVIDIIAKAKESVRVIGLYRPPSLEITSGRKKYYDALASLLEAKRRRNERFRYERVIQVDKIDPGKLSSNQVDALTFEHCKQLVKLQKQRTTLTVHLWQLPDILGSLSFVIVDDRIVIFAIPAANPSDAKDPRALHIGTVVVFTDPEHSLAKEMFNLYDELRLNADAIQNIASDSTNAQSKTLDESSNPPHIESSV